MKLKLFLLPCFLLLGVLLFSQTESANINIYYSAPIKYAIGEIEFKGTDAYSKEMLSSTLGLHKGMEVVIPSTTISEAIKKLYGTGLFSHISISASKIENGVIDLDITVKQPPQLRTVFYEGLKKSEKEDLQSKLNLSPGMRITDYVKSIAERYVKADLESKGFAEAEVLITVKKADDGYVNMYIEVKRNEKLKVKRIEIAGNKIFKDKKIERKMKKTNEKAFRNFFKTKKFITEEYENDKQATINHLNEKGYRDAEILSDSIYVDTNQKKKKVEILLTIKEGTRYYFGDIKWIGNSLQPNEFLDRQLGIVKGDVYNSKKMSKRLNEDETSISRMYNNSGYLTFYANPVEKNIYNDTIDFEIRLSEGEQFSINDVIINGNERISEKVIRRELRVLPGDLYSYSKLERSLREIMQLGYIAPPPETKPNVVPHIESSTADIVFDIAESSNSQLQLSGGYGAGMWIFSGGFSFTNFSIKNIFNFEHYAPLPAGDGQTFSFHLNTTGQAYRSFDMSFTEPWLGGNKPNRLTVSLYLSHQIYVNNRYYNSPTVGGFGTNSYGNNFTSDNVDPNRYQNTTSISVGLQRRLKWPDDFFYMYNGISIRQYQFKNWSPYVLGLQNGLATGSSTQLPFQTIVGRNSTDNPIFPHSGSDVTLGLDFTLPYSWLFNWDVESMDNVEKARWVEYYKITYKNDFYVPLAFQDKLVLRFKGDFGYIGYYNKNKPANMVQYSVGGSGMSGAFFPGRELIPLRGYQDGALSEYFRNGLKLYGSRIYERLVSELRFAVVMSAQSTIWALAFVEGGNAWYDSKDFDPFNLKRSAGVGIHFMLPMIGMLGIDWGYGFDKTSPISGQVSGSQFHFTFGQQL